MFGRPSPHDWKNPGIDHGFLSPSDFVMAALSRATSNAVISAKSLQRQHSCQEKPPGLNTCALFRQRLGLAIDQRSHHPLENERQNGLRPASLAGRYLWCEQQAAFSKILDCRIVKPTPRIP
jgi:hypothetical protein